MSRSLIAVIIVICLPGGLITGCSRQNEPEDVLHQYLYGVQDGKFAEGYELLTSDVKEKIAQEKFILWQELSREIVELRGFKFTQVKQGTDIILGDRKYPEYVEVEAEETNYEYYSGAEHVDIARHYIVKDNGTWKLYLNLDIDKAIAQNYFSIGMMYIDGFGKELQVEKAADYFKEALATDVTLTDAHYSLGVAYMLIGQYSQSLEQETIYLQKSQDNEGKSEAYVIIGLNYRELGETEKAKEAFIKALEINPENNYAVEHLQQ